MEWTWAVIAAAIGVGVGFALGRALTITSLLIGAERPDRTPHNLGGRFYYLVREGEYCELCADRERLAEIVSDWRD